MLMGKKKGMLTAARRRVLAPGAPALGRSGTRVSSEKGQWTDITVPRRKVAMRSTLKKRQLKHWCSLLV